MKCSKSKLLLAAACVLSFYATTSEVVAATDAALLEALKTGKTVRYTRKDGTIYEGKLEATPNPTNNLSLVNLTTTDRAGRQVLVPNIGIMNSPTDLHFQPGIAARIAITDASSTPEEKTSRYNAGLTSQQIPPAYSSAPPTDIKRNQVQTGTHQQSPNLTSYANGDATKDDSTPIRTDRYTKTRLAPTSTVKTERRPSATEIGAAVGTNTLVTYSIPNGTVAKGTLKYVAEENSVRFEGMNERGEAVIINRIGFYDPKGNFILSPKGMAGKMTILRRRTDTDIGAEQAPESYVPVNHSQGHLTRNPTGFEGAKAGWYPVTRDNGRPLDGKKKPRRGPVKYYLITKDGNQTEGELVCTKRSKVVYFVNGTQKIGIGGLVGLTDSFLTSDGKQLKKSDGQPAQNTDLTYDKKTDSVKFEGQVLRTIAD